MTVEPTVAKLMCNGLAHSSAAQASSRCSELSQFWASARTGEFHHIIESQVSWLISAKVWNLEIPGIHASCMHQKQQRWAQSKGEDNEFIQLPVGIGRAGESDMLNNT